MTNPTVPTQSESFVSTNTFFGWLAAVAVGLASTGWIAYGNLMEKNEQLATQVAEMRTTLNTVREFLKNPKTFPGAEGTPHSEEKVAEAPPKPVTPETTKPGSMSLPPHIATTPPPACVERKLHTRFPCEQASECVPLSGFSPAHQKKVRADARLADDIEMNICSQRTPEAAGSP